jgi:hypothetical protein
MLNTGEESCTYRIVTQALIQYMLILGTLKRKARMILKICPKHRKIDPLFSLRLFSLRLFPFPL